MYLNENKPDEALRILLKFSKAGFNKAFGEIGVIIYREKHDVEKAEEWFVKAEKEECLLAPAAFSYTELLMLEKDDWEKSESFLSNQLRKVLSLRTLNMLQFYT